MKTIRRAIHNGPVMAFGVRGEFLLLGIVFNLILWAHGRLIFKNIFMARHVPGRPYWCPMVVDSDHVPVPAGDHYSNNNNIS